MIERVGLLGLASLGFFLSYDVAPKLLAESPKVPTSGDITGLYFLAVIATTVMAGLLGNKVGQEMDKLVVDLRHKIRPT